MKRFLSVHLETSSMCNRVCPTCIRNSTPDRDSVADWFNESYLPMETIEELFRQLGRGRFICSLYLSFYNEPLLDSRILDIATMAKAYGKQRIRVALVTNGDFLTPELASKLDDVLTWIEISIYKNGRRRIHRSTVYFESLFKKARVVTRSKHIVSHYNSACVLTDETLCSQHLNRLVINHKGEYILCCEEMIPHFGLGKFPDTSIIDYYWGEKRSAVIQDLHVDGKRQLYPYCKICPRVLRRKAEYRTIA